MLRADMLGYAATLILIAGWLLLHFFSFYRSKRVSGQVKSKSTSISRNKHYIGSMIGSSSIGILAIFVAYFNRVPVFGSIYIDHRISLTALGFLALNILIIEPLEWKQISEEIKQRYGNFCPHTANERFMWVPVSMVIAVSEEILYRAVFFGIFYQLTDNYWVAGLISAALFAGAHWKYGLTALPTAFFVAIGLQYLVNISGGLYAAIAVHFIHNLVNGIIYGWIQRKKMEIGEAIIPGDIAVVDQAPELD